MWGRSDVPDLIEKVGSTSSKAFIVSCRDDGTVPIDNSVALIHALEKNGVSFECHIYGAGVHGFSLAKALTSSGDKNYVCGRVAAWADNAIEWLKETVGDIEFTKARELPPGLSRAFYIPIKDLLENENTGKILLAVSDVFKNDIILNIIKDATLAEFILTLSLSDEQISALSEELEKAL